MSNLNRKIIDMAKKAKDASRRLPLLSTKKKNEILLAMARAIIASKPTIQKANKKDIMLAKDAGLNSAFGH